MVVSAAVHLWFHRPPYRQEEQADLIYLAVRSEPVLPLPSAFLRLGLTWETSPGTADAASLHPRIPAAAAQLGTRCRPTAASPARRPARTESVSPAQRGCPASRLNQNLWVTKQGVVSIPETGGEFKIMCMCLAVV